MTGGAGTPGALPFLALQERGFKGGVYGNHGMINPDFLRVAGSAATGAFLPTGPVIVADQLPANYPTRKMTDDFRAAFLKVNGAPSTDAFSAYSFDGYLVFADAAARAIAPRPSRARRRFASPCAMPSPPPRKWSARTASTTSRPATSTASTSGRGWW